MKKLYKTNTNAFFTFFPLVLLVTVTFIAAYQLINSNPLAKVKKGTHDLYCNFYIENSPADRRKVDPNLVIDFVEGTWLFVNGSASNCELVSKTKHL